MELNERLVRELVGELNDLKDSMREVVRELHKLNSLDQIQQTYKEEKYTLKEIMGYLEDYQAVVDYQMDDRSNERKFNMENLQGAVQSVGSLLDTDRTGVSALAIGRAILSSNAQPIYANSKDFLQYIAENTIPGISTTNRIYYRYGQRIDVATSSYQLLSDGDDTEIGTPGTTLRLFSASANDTLNGSGVQKVTVSGINSSGIRTFETVNMAGTTHVTTTTTYNYIDFLAASQSGTFRGVAAGKISATNGAGTITYGSISAGQNSWLNAQFFVDSTQRGYIHEMHMNGFKEAMNYELRTSINGGQNTEIIRAGSTASSSGNQVIFPAPIVVTSNGQSYLTAMAAQANGNAYGGFTLHVTS